MRRSRFAETQIVAILQEAEAGGRGIDFSVYSVGFACSFISAIFSCFFVIFSYPIGVKENELCRPETCCSAS